MSANLSLAFLATLCVTTLFTIGTNAQTSSSCSTALVSLSPCLNYISGNDTTPSGSCCSQLASVVKSEPECLCAVLNGDSSSSLGITINETRALELPSACKVQTPSASNCKSTLSPTTPSSPPSSETGNTGSKSVPDTLVDSGATSQTTNVIFFLGVLAASIAMIG